LKVTSIDGRLKRNRGSTESGEVRASTEQVVVGRAT
jgi:hypothetical protein